MKYAFFDVKKGGCSPVKILLQYIYGLQHLLPSDEYVYETCGQRVKKDVTPYFRGHDCTFEQKLSWTLKANYLVKEAMFAHQIIFLATRWLVAWLLNGRHLKALVFLYAFEESIDCHLLSSFCDDSNLHISLFKYVLSTMSASKESISKFLIGNQFHVKLSILSPENCKQSLRVKSWKAEVTAEKKQTQDYNQNFVTQAHKS